MKDVMRNEIGAPKVVDRSTFHAELDALRVREKAHTREGDVIAAARRWLPIVTVDVRTPLIGERGAVTLGSPATHRLLLHVACRSPGGGAVRGVQPLYIAGPRVVFSAFSRRHLRHVLPGPVRRERPLPRLHGLGDALVLGGPELAQNSLGRTPGRHDAYRLLPATRSQCLRDLLDDDARR